MRRLRPAPFRTGTALPRYERLEAVGRWREAPGAPVREVVVSFGAASLVLSDAADVTLGHWALAGLRVLGRDGEGTRYAMTPDGYETLAIADPEMVAAIDAVSAAASGFPEPARPRRWPWIVAGLGLVAAAAAAAPPLLRDQAARMMPPEAARQAGDEMLLRLIETVGQPCAEPAGVAALARLAEAAGEPPPRLQVLALGTAPAAALPGDLVVVDRATLAAADQAGLIALIRGVRTAEPAPVEALMAAAGPVANLRYILTGSLPETGLARGVAALTRAAGTAPGPADPPPPATADDAPLAPADWAALRAICG
jgi:hypothetical protein